MSSVNPADYKDNVVGQAVVSTMNLGASTAEVQAMLNAATTFQTTGNAARVGRTYLRYAG